MAVLSIGPTVYRYRQSHHFSYAFLLSERRSADCRLTQPFKYRAAVETQASEPEAEARL